MHLLSKFVLANTTYIACGTRGLQHPLHKITERERERLKSAKKQEDNEFKK